MFQRHFSKIGPERFAFGREISKSGRELLKCKDTQSQWDMIVELCPMKIIFEKLSEDGTLGHFGITDPRRANYTASLDCRDAACIEFMESIFAAFTAFLGHTATSLPLTGDTLKVKRRLCKWAADGVEPERNPIEVVQWDGTKHVSIEHCFTRGDIIQPVVKISPWTVPDSDGISLEIISIQLISKAPPQSTQLQFSIPDLPPLKRRRV